LHRQKALEVVMLLEVAIAVALGRQQDSSAAARELESIEHQLAASWNAGDCAGWGAVVAPEWSVIHINGEVIRREDVLQMCQEPRPPNQELSIDELSVRTFGDTAVVTGRTRVITGGDDASTLTLRFTDVFIRRAGRWQVVASHATRLAQ
jgi:ketosteroid isomerase-like protein